LPIADAGADQAICLGDSAVLGSSEIAGSNYYWSIIYYQYDPSLSYLNNTLSNPKVSPPSAGNYDYTLTVSNTCGTVYDYVTVTVNPLPTVNAGTDTTINSGQSVILGTPEIIGNTYSWSPTDGLNNPNIAQPTANPAITTEYILTITDGNNCTATDTVIVTVNLCPAATITADSDTILCQGDSIKLTASPASANYLWSNGKTTPFIYVKDTGNYTVTVSDNICTDTAQITITKRIRPVTKLIPTECGNTNVSIHAVLHAKNIGCQGKYEFVVTDTTLDSNNVYHIVRPDSILYLDSVCLIMKYSTTYTVAVRTMFQGDVSAYGDTCFFRTVDSPSTQLNPPLCGKTFNLDGILRAKNKVDCAMLYQFRLIEIDSLGMNGDTLGAVSSDTTLQLKEFPCDRIKFNTRYDVSIATLAGNVWSDFGSTCSIFTTPHPTTKLNPMWCDSVVSFYDNLYHYLISISPKWA